MTTRQQERKKTGERAIIWRLVLACGIGLVLGALGNALGWNQLANPWPYLGLLCPFLLGLSVALIAGKRTHLPLWPKMLGISVFAWMGFYLVFMIIAYQIHPYNPPQPALPPSPSDQVCSPCFSSDALATGFLTLAFLPIGPFEVLLMACATRGVVLAVHRLFSPSFPPRDVVR